MVPRELDKSGTLEELLETITWKRLGIHGAPILIFNEGGFYDPLLAQLRACVEEKFMAPRHLEMWSVVESVEELLRILKNPPDWDADARNFAQL